MSFGSDTLHGYMMYLARFLSTVMNNNNNNNNNNDNNDIKNDNK